MNRASDTAMNHFLKNKEYSMFDIAAYSISKLD
jgi:hypothetical protein